MALQTATSRITCRVHWPDSNRTTSREILIPADYMRSCSLITEVTVGTVVVLALACGLVGFLFKMCDKCAAGQKQSMSREELRDSTERHTFESQLLMKREDVADNKANSKVEELEKQVDELKSKLREKNKNSFRSQPGPVQHNQPTLPSKLSPDVFKSTTSTNDHIPNSTISADNHPTSATVPRNEGPNPGIQRIRRRNSSPPMLCANTATSLSSSASTSKRNRCSVSGFINTSYADPDPVHAKLQRKRSSGCMSPHFDNQYSVLVDVPDESEPDQSSEDSH
uniref:uncharacterized protein LOC109953373 isoform X1 n=1 Tax=Monopterus albus TaxID=43700 RepID=UPI0009B3580D|nr:uncharacterized protein LOC109953373 isoform X1 [Monopterus albus]